MHSFGTAFRITVFGESHGPVIGVVIDGVPPGISLSLENIKEALARRKPRIETGGTPRKEADEPEILSGIYEGHTTGAPLTIVVKNTAAQSEEYDLFRFCPRPGHADYSAWVKYRGYNDIRGGGMFSARLTVAYVLAGAVAQEILRREKISVFSHVVRIGEYASRIRGEDAHGKPRDMFGCVDPSCTARFHELVEEARKNGDSLGGEIETIVTAPAGLGEPIFDNVESVLAHALFAIPSVKGVVFGNPQPRGSANNDPFTVENGVIRTTTNHAGGILGGITMGMPVIFTTLFKPIPTIRKEQHTVDLRTLTPTTIKGRGRHDVCAVPRAVPIVEAITGIVFADFVMRGKQWSV